MEPVTLALSAALVLSLVALAVFVMLWMGERTAHHAAKEWAEAEQTRFTAYRELVEDERRATAARKVMELVQPYFDDVNS